MNRKITFLMIVSFIFGTYLVQGQFFNVGLKTGVTFANQTQTITPTPEGFEGMFEDQKRLVAPELGVNFEIGITDEMFIGTGLSFRLKGFKFKSERDIGTWEESDVRESDETVLSAELHLPIQFGYKYDLGEVKIFGMVGPYFDNSLYMTNLYKIDGEIDNDNSSFTSGTADTNYIKPFEIGIAVDVGVQYNRFQLSFFYNQCLNNLAGGLFNYEGAEEEVAIKNNVFGISLGIIFGNVDAGSGSGFRRR